MTSNDEHHEWIPMPSGLSLTHHSFAGEILQQFNLENELSDINTQIEQDKEENIVVEEYNSIMSQSTKSSSIHDDDNDNNNADNNNNNNNRIDTTSTPAEKRIQTTTPSRRRSAGDLLRKSSVYLRNRYVAMKSNIDQMPQKQEKPKEQQQQQHTSRFRSWNLNNKKKRKRKNSSLNYKNQQQQQQQQQQQSNDNTALPSNSNNTPLSKLAIHTTIKLSPPSAHQRQYLQTNVATSNSGSSAVHPPVITQYPPIPLKYSPVEPLLELDGHAGTQQKPKYSSSLRLSNEQQQQHEEEYEESRNSNVENRQLRHGIGLQWNRLLFNCGIRK